MMRDLGTDEIDGLIEAVDLAHSDQEHYLHTGNPELDYGDEWPDVAQEKARRFRGMASAMREFGLPTIAGECDALAQEFEEHCNPGLCVTCGAQCVSGGEGSVICPNADRHPRGPFRIGMEPTGGGQ